MHRVVNIPADRRGPSKQDKFAHQIDERRLTRCIPIHIPVDTIRLSNSGIEQLNWNATSASGTSYPIAVRHEELYTIIAGTGPKVKMRLSVTMCLHQVTYCHSRAVQTATLRPFKNCLVSRPSRQREKTSCANQPDLRWGSPFILNLPLGRRVVSSPSACNAGSS